MDSRLIRGSIAIAVLALHGPLAAAATTEYTDPTAFAAATSSGVNYNFEGIAPAGNFTFGDATVGGVTFTAGGGSDFVIDANAGYAQYGASFFSGQAAVGSSDPSEVVCTLSGGVTAIGFTYGDYVDASLPFTVNLSNGDTFSLTTPLNAGLDTGFVGFVSSTPITSVTFSDAGYAFDVVQFDKADAGATSVPEPGTLALMGTGLLGMALLRQRRTIKLKA